jgi:multiple sugar transport system permease protein
MKTGPGLTRGTPGRKFFPEDSMLISRNVRETKKDRALSWVFLLPVIIILTIAAFIPLGYGFALSFYKYKLNMPGMRPLFIGLENYVTMFKDELFIKSLTNNIFFAVLSVGSEVLVGVIVAMMLSEDSRLSKLMTTILLVPMIIAPVASGTLWRMMLDRTFGVVNYLMSFLNIPPVAWLASDKVAIYTIVFVDFWQFMPYVAVLILSSVKAIPDSFMDAARVDGASSLRLFFKVVLPLITPVIIIVAMVRFIDAFKVFDTIFVMTQGGPGSATEMLPTYIYRQGIKFFQVGYSSATAILFIIAMSLIAAAFNKLRSYQLRRLG